MTKSTRIYIDRRVSLVLLLCSVMSVCGYSQDKTKSKQKTTDELLCISYEDIYGQCISTSDETKFKRSLEASKDKDLCRDNYINCMLYPENEGAGISITCNPASYDKFKDSPHLSACRDADPFLVLAGWGSHFLAESDPNFFKSMTAFIDWQRKYTPHSPLCAHPGGAESHNPDDDLTVPAKAKVHVTSSIDWVIKYPAEYRLILKQFDSCYGIWQKQFAGSRTDFIKYYSNIVGHDIDKECKILINTSPTGILSGFRALMIPSDADMRKNIKGFISEAYENLYMRLPTQQEIKFLETYIDQNKNLSVKEFYYAMMTSEEYKYF